MYANGNGQPISRAWGKTILLVEDDTFIRSFMAEDLRDQGWVVDECCDGQEAITYLETFKPDLIVLDMGLPVYDGRYVAKRAYDRYGKNLQVLVVSAAGDTEVAAKEIEASDYLAKPFDLDDLSRRVQALIGSARLDNYPGAR